MDTPLPSPVPADPAQRAARLWNRARELSKLYLLVLPSATIILLIGYYPKIDVVIKSMYRWVPGEVEEFIGLKNFVDAFSDPLFWQSFRLIFILLLANLVKMWPGIFAAVALHRLTNTRLRYRFQVCFVIPMIIPGMVWLLIWKSFYDPEFGVLNRMLNATGLMRVLYALDGNHDAWGLAPRLARFLQPLLEGPVAALFGSTWGIMLLGAFFLVLASHDVSPSQRRRAGGLLLAAALLPALALVPRADAGGPSPTLLLLVLPAFALLMAGVARTVGSRWVLWMFLLLGGLYAFRGRWGLLPAHMALAFGLSEAFRTALDRFQAERRLKIAGTAALATGAVLLLAGEIWTEPIGQFEAGTPAWLGNPDLVIPALLFWGFPWVGTMGVLIYLAGLQRIPTDVYEAAQLDGISPLGMLFRIEMPLILTQIRINLIFMTIATLTGYEMFLILLGPSGGPGNRGMVPGLYMFSKAFLEGQFGYACALGMVLFVIILGLTIVYQRYVKVKT